MKKSYILFLLLSFAGLSVLAQYSSEEKLIDQSEYVNSNKADNASGSLDGSDPMYDRQFGNGYSINCDHVSNASGNTGTYYDIYPIYTSTGEALDISTTTTGGTSDLVMFLYCDPFDPLNPDLNLVAVDDDDGPGFMPAFVPVDAYTITANTQYYLVLTTFSSGASGTYDISMGGDLVFGTYAPPPVPLSNWAFALIGVLVLSFVIFKFRK